MAARQLHIIFICLNYYINTFESVGTEYPFDGTLLTGSSSTFSELFFDT